jgi:hypothetical protein
MIDQSSQDGQELLKRIRELLDTIPARQLEMYFIARSIDLNK